MTDADLLRGLQEDKPNAWKVFVRCHGPRMLKTIELTLNRFGWGADKQSRDDIFQSILHEMIKKKRFATISKPCALGSYMRAICISRTIDASRARIKKERSTIHLMDESWESSMAIKSTDENRIILSEAVAVVEEILLDCSQKEAAFIRLHVQEGVTLSELAEMSNISKDTIASIVRRTKIKIRKLLESKGINASILRGINE